MNNKSKSPGHLFKSKGLMPKNKSNILIRVNPVAKVYLVATEKLRNKERGLLRFDREECLLG